MFACRLLPSGCYIKQVSVEYIKTLSHGKLFGTLPSAMHHWSCSHSLGLLIGQSMEIIIQSIPEKNLLVEFHSRRFENISCDRGFKLEMVLKLSELLSMRFSVSKILNKSSRIRHTDLSRSWSSLKGLVQCPFPTEIGVYGPSSIPRSETEDQV